MGRFGQMMIYFGNGSVLTCIHHVPLLSEHEVNRGTLNVFINIMKKSYLRLTVA